MKWICVMALALCGCAGVTEREAGFGYSTDGDNHVGSLHYGEYNREGFGFLTSVGLGGEFPVVVTRQQARVHRVQAAVARDDAEVERRGTQAAGDGVRPRAQLVPRGSVHPGETGQVGHFVDQLAAPIRRSEHDHTIQVRNSVFVEILPQHDSPQRVGDKVDPAVATM